MAVLATRDQAQPVQVNVVDRIQAFVKEGCAVVLHDNLQRAHIFHRCISQKTEEKSAKPKEMCLRNITVIYINLHDNLDLLHGRDGWLKKLEKGKCYECECALEKEIRKGAGEELRAMELILSPSELL